MHEFAVLIGAKAQKWGKTKKVYFENQVVFFTLASKQFLVAQLVRRQYTKSKGPKFESRPLLQKLLRF